MRKPRNSDLYSEAEEAGQRLIALGERMKALEGTKIKWSIQISIWNDELQESAMGATEQVNCQSWPAIPCLSVRGRE